VPEPVQNLIGMQELRLAIAPLGAVVVQVGKDGVRITGTGITLDEARALRERLDGVIATPTRDELRLPVGESGSPADRARELADGIIGLRSEAP
ncbi:MAG: hypothetical protein ACR2JV_02200, partial [Gaiellales bacterium]